MTPEWRSEELKRAALEIGFDSAGITDLSPTPHADALDAWLAQGYAADMSYMHRQAQLRKTPSAIVADAKFALVVTRNHFAPDPPRSAGRGLVARYARSRDYHETVGADLKSLVAHVRDLGNEATIARPYVDAGPVPERELAQRAGLGWIGKNTMLIDPSRGSYSFVGSILTNLELAVDHPFEWDRCGTCTRCLDVCPAQAFPAPRILDSTRCISYLTIEHRGEYSEDQRAWGDHRIFGCDLCQDVCPWNQKFAAVPHIPMPDFDPTLAWLDLAVFQTMTAEEFELRFGWTPLERPGLAGMRRNAQLALEREKAS
ncbi:MAG: tRNA epoxyqueuosine(34) reductase QueG [Gemmatimonadales bacterium]